MKRGYLDLSRHFDESYPTISAISPLICFASTFTVLVLLRIVVSFGAVAARCVQTDQFWYTPAKGNWPLFASFVLILFLLLVWNALVALNDWPRSKGTKVMVIVNTLAIIATTYTFVSLNDNAYFQYHQRRGHYDDIKFRPFSIPPLQMEHECITMQRFAGRWRAVEKELGYYGFDVPSLWIELKPWGGVLAADTTWQAPYQGRWGPPYQSRYSDDKRWRDGYIRVGDFDAPWDFELRGDVLILTTSDYFEDWQKSRIVLERDDAK